MLDASREPKIPSTPEPAPEAEPVTYPCACTNTICWHPAAWLTGCSIRVPTERGICWLCRDSIPHPCG